MKNKPLKKESPKKKKGFAVRITRKDGTESLALSGGGVYPFIHPNRIIAALYRKNLLQWGFGARNVKVVLVSYYEPVVIPIPPKTQRRSVKRNVNLKST